MSWQVADGRVVAHLARVRADQPFKHGRCRPGAKTGSGGKTIM